MPEQVGDVFAVAVLPDYPGVTLKSSTVGAKVITVDVAIAQAGSVELSVERPVDNMVPLFEALEALEQSLNTYIDTHHIHLDYPGNPDWD